MKKGIVVLLLCCSFIFVGCGGDNTQKQIDELTAKIEQLQSDATISQSTIEELQNQTAAQKEQIKNLEKDNLLWQDHVLDGYGLRTSYKSPFSSGRSEPLPWSGEFNYDYRRRKREAYVDDVTVSDVDLKLNYTNNGCYEKKAFLGVEKVGEQWKEVVDIKLQLIVYDREAIDNLGKIINPDLVHVIREIPSEEFFSEKYGFKEVPIDQNQSFIKYAHEEVIKIPSKMFQDTYVGEDRTLYIGLSWYNTYADGTRDSEIQVDYLSIPLFYIINYYSVDGRNIYDSFEGWAYKKIILSDKEIY